MIAADVIIATFCLERNHALLHDDRDFDSFVALGLSVI
jgi:predicted nucleic acid-binding protein